MSMIEMQSTYNPSPGLVGACHSAFVKSEWRIVRGDISATLRPLLQLPIYKLILSLPLLPTHTSHSKLSDLLELTASMWCTQRKGGVCVATAVVLKSRRRFDLEQRGYAPTQFGISVL
jgi:hypothetical protein